MTDLGLPTLLAAIDGLPEGATVTADSCRYVFDAAQLNPSERGAAFKAACRLGYLTGTDRVIRSQVPSRKNSANRVWLRTGKAVTGRRVA